MTSIVVLLLIAGGTIFLRFRALLDRESDSVRPEQNRDRVHAADAVSVN